MVFDDHLLFCYLLKKPNKPRFLTAVFGSTALSNTILLLPALTIFVNDNTKLLISCNSRIYFVKTVNLNVVICVKYFVDKNKSLNFSW